MKALIFPHQIYADSELFNHKITEFHLIEDSLFFGDSVYPIAFHKQKITLHRATLKYYQDFLQSKFPKAKIFYHEYKETYNYKEFYQKLFAANHKFVVQDPTDFILSKRLHRFCKNLEVLKSPNFICSTDELTEFFKNKKTFFQTTFYKYQREKHQILMTDGKPVGGRLTFDTENRKKLPKDNTPPDIFTPPINKYLTEAITYTNRNFSKNPGYLSVENFIHPITHSDAIAAMHNFFKHRFSQFGPYEDAITNRSDFLYHSVLSSSINCGLLNPMQVIQEALKQKHASIESLEGFIRQILGWREFMRAVYLFKGVEQRNSNFFKHKKPLPASFWDATTGIPPIDDSIKKALKFAYSHHIERLMLLGNFMNLSEIEPDQIYNWFMAMYIDAYDWVMVPNVYGMSLFADGGLITTKPYVSSSNYVLKMSDYKKGDWCDLWDSLYWNFIQKHQDFLSKNIRFSMIIRQLEKMTPEKKQKLKEIS